MGFLSQWVALAAAEGMDDYEDDQGVYDTQYYVGDEYDGYGDEYEDPSQAREQHNSWDAYYRAEQPDTQFYGQRKIVHEDRTDQEDSAYHARDRVDGFATQDEQTNAERVEAYRRGVTMEADDGNCGTHRARDTSVPPVRRRQGSSGQDTIQIGAQNYQVGQDGRLFVRKNNTRRSASVASSNTSSITHVNGIVPPQSQRLRSSSVASDWTSDAASAQQPSEAPSRPLSRSSSLSNQHFPRGTTPDATLQTIKSLKDEINRLKRDKRNEQRILAQLQGAHQQLQ